jgi:hypothetical protein
VSTRDKEADVKMFGCEIEPFVDSVEKSLAFKFSGPGMVIISLLSDVQELISMGRKEDARQTINRAKFLVDRFLPSQHSKADSDAEELASSGGAPEG